MQVFVINILFWVLFWWHSFSADMWYWYSTIKYSLTILNVLSIIRFAFLRARRVEVRHPVPGTAPGGGETGNNAEFCSDDSKAEWTATANEPRAHGERAKSSGGPRGGAGGPLAWEASLAPCPAGVCVAGEPEAQVLASDWTEFKAKLTTSASSSVKRGREWTIPPRAFVRIKQSQPVIWGACYLSLMDGLTQNKRTLSHLITGNSSSPLNLGILHTSRSYGTHLCSVVVTRYRTSAQGEELPLLPTSFWFSILMVSPK